MRQVLERPGEKEQNQRDGGRGRNLRKLALRAAPSTIAVCVGLPFTTKAPVNPATALPPKGRPGLRPRLTSADDVPRTPAPWPRSA